MALAADRVRSKFELGVSSIEYALLAALIALAAIGGFSLLGGTQESGWNAWSSKVVEIVSGE